MLSYSKGSLDDVWMVGTDVGYDLCSDDDDDVEWSATAGCWFSNMVSS
jgi:hypothetical protein